MAKIPDDDDGGILMPILVSLLVVVGLVTAGLFGYIGYHAKMNQAAIIPGSSQEQPQTPTQSQQHAIVSQQQTPEQDYLENKINQSQQIEPVQNNQNELKQPDKSEEQESSKPQPSKDSSQEQTEPEPEPVITTPTPSKNTNSAGNERRSNWANGTYLGSKESDKYHDYECRAAENILPENEVWFSSEEEARAAGYSRCGICW